MSNLENIPPEARRLKAYPYLVLSLFIITSVTTSLLLKYSVPIKDVFEYLSLTLIIAVFLFAVELIIRFVLSEPAKKALRIIVIPLCLLMPLLMIYLSAVNFYETHYCGISKGTSSDPFGACKGKIRSADLSSGMTVWLPVHSAGGKDIREHCFLSPDGWSFAEPLPKVAQVSFPTPDAHPNNYAPKVNGPVSLTASADNRRICGRIEVLHEQQNDRYVSVYVSAIVVKK